jgi:hypothetical protein
MKERHVSIVTGLVIEWRDSLMDALHAGIKGLWPVSPDQNHQMNGALLGEKLARW